MNSCDMPRSGKEDKCFACDKTFKPGQKVFDADTRDDQLVVVGSDCFKKIKSSGESGYQPPKGGPVLYMPTDEGMSVETYYIYRGQP